MFGKKSFEYNLNKYVIKKLKIVIISIIFLRKKLLVF